MSHASIVPLRKALPSELQNTLHKLKAVKATTLSRLSPSMVSAISVSIILHAALLIGNVAFNLTRDSSKHFTEVQERPSYQAVLTKSSSQLPAEPIQNQMTSKLAEQVISPAISTLPSLQSAPTTRALAVVLSDYHLKSSLDVPPQALTEITPQYPANDNYQEGTVVVRVLINEFGLVDETRIVRSFPSGLFDNAAQEAFQKTIFSPGKILGIPVKSQLLVEMSFTPFNRGGMVNGRLN